VDGTKAYLGSNLQQFGDHVPLLLVILGSYVVFFNASATFASFCIPHSERRRILGPISDGEFPPTLTRTRVAIALMATQIPPLMATSNSPTLKAA
jgi:hypothetical protein